MMSTFFAMSGTFAAIFGLLGSKKWIIRLGRNGTSATGAGAPTARGRRKALGLRTRVTSVDDKTTGQYADLPMGGIGRGSQPQPGPSQSPTGRPTLSA